MGRRLYRNVDYIEMICVPIYILRHFAEWDADYIEMWCATEWSASPCAVMLQHTATHCNTLQHTATHFGMGRRSLPLSSLPKCCSVLQCVAVYIWYKYMYKFHLSRLPKCVAVCCSTLRHISVWDADHCLSQGYRNVAVCCSVLQYTYDINTCINSISHGYRNVSQCVAVCCSVLQYHSTRRRSSFSRRSSSFFSWWVLYRVAKTHRMPQVAGRFWQKSH